MADYLSYHKKFTPEEFEAQYNLRLRRPDYEQTVVPDWTSRSEAAKSTIPCKLDIRYGNGERQKLDVYRCNNSSAATLLYIHGGYWQRGDKSMYAFMAKPFVDAGVNVIVVGYDLCPDVTVTRISEEIREAIAYIYQHANELEINRDRISIMGHSAGGHLTEMMMGTDWAVYNSALPADLLKAGIPISPLSYLEPVRLTEGLNCGIRLTAAEAESQSPMLNHPPLSNAPQIVIVGGAETAEFHRQAQMYVDTFNANSRSVELFVIPDVDHFDELNVITDPESEIFRRIGALVNR